MYFFDGSFFICPFNHIDNNRHPEKQMKKHQQHIVAIPAHVVKSRVDGIVELPADLSDELVLKRRATLLNDFNYRKVIPLTVFVSGGKVAAFSRKMDHQHEALRGKITVGIGGHFEVSDLVFDGSVVDLPSSLAEASAREVEEEVILGARQLRAVALKQAIAADETITDRQYIALVTVVELEAQDIAPNQEEDELDWFGWYLPEELLSAGGDRCETWTKKICNILFNMDTL
tara:strand:+ start:177776 stop:178468 length:693 start_codon:yes stop_codon:yes gene_type:complete